MIKSSAAALPAQDFDPHAELTRAHQEAGRLSRLLSESLGLAPVMNLAEAQKQMLEIGNALRRIARAERDCGACTGHNHGFSTPYREMLDQQRLAFIEFERLAKELESPTSFSGGDCARLAADIEYHLKRAETNHRATIWVTGPQKR